MDYTQIGKIYVINNYQPQPRHQVSRPAFYDKYESRQTNL